MNSLSPLEFDELYRRLDEAEHRLSRGLSDEEQKALLERRAAALAVSYSQAEVASLPVVSFRVATERYAVRVEEAEQVLPIKSLAALAGAPRHVLGAVVARSRIVPVLDLRQMLGFGGRGASDLTAVVAVRCGDEVLGLAAEEVEGRRELPVAELEKPASGPFHYLAPGRLAILDLDRLLGSDADAKAGN